MMIFPARQIQDTLGERLEKVGLRLVPLGTGRSDVFGLLSIETDEKLKEAACMSAGRVAYSPDDSA